VTLPVVANSEPTSPVSLRPLKGSPRKPQAKGGRKAPLQGRGPLAVAHSQSIDGTLDESSEFDDVASLGNAATPSSPSRQGWQSSRPDGQATPSRPGTSWSQGLSSALSEKSEAYLNLSGRLYATQKPWVADVTDRDLLQYLALRSGDPDIASPSTSQMASRSIGDSFNSPSKAHRRNYRNHRELFDDCLDRETSPSPPPKDESHSQERSAKVTSAAARPALAPSGTRPLYSPQKLAKAQVARDQTRHLIDQIEDIPVIPQDPVRVFLETEKESPYYADLTQNGGSSDALDRRRKQQGITPKPEPKRLAY
jgi:hypothetical protein